MDKVLELKLTAICPDLSSLGEETISELIAEHSDSDIIVFPEYLLELCKFTLPVIKNKLIIFGSKQLDGVNSLVLSVDGEFSRYAKSKLTPWENDLNAGESLCCFQYKGVSIAVLVCFDVEFPDLAQCLKSVGVDLLIVPSATESKLGYERVNRCASARSVELGCAVVSCHLVGKTNLELLDVNVGNHNLFLPSQSFFANENRSEIQPMVIEGPVIREYRIPVDKIRRQRRVRGESNPSLLLY